MGGRRNEYTARYKREEEKTKGKFNNYLFFFCFFFLIKFYKELLTDVVFSGESLKLISRGQQTSYEKNNF